MDERLRMVTRVRHVKESLQEQAETQLANAVARLRELESSIAELERRKQDLMARGVFNVLDLQSRMLYGDYLAVRLNEFRNNADAVESEVEEQRRKVQEAYVETHRWSTLEELQLERVEQETQHKNQVLADELAVQNYFRRGEGR